GMMPAMKKTALFLILVLFSFIGAYAAVKLPAVFGNNMVLQQNAMVNIWGSFDHGNTVYIKTSWDNKTYRVKPSSEGRWKTQLKTPGAGGPYVISFNDSD